MLSAQVRITVGRQYPRHSSSSQSAGGPDPKGPFWAPFPSASIYFPCCGARNDKMFVTWGRKGIALVTSIKESHSSLPPPWRHKEAEVCLRAVLRTEVSIRAQDPMRQSSFLPPQTLDTSSIFSNGSDAVDLRPHPHYDRRKSCRGKRR